MKLYRYIPLFPLLIILLLSIPTPEVSSDSTEEMCPVHHLPLKRERLEIIYGLVATVRCDTWDRTKAEEKYFPYANSESYGGCLMDADSPKYKEVLYCPKCRAVEKTWPCIETHSTPMITNLP